MLPAMELSMMAIKVGPTLPWAGEPSFFTKANWFPQPPLLQLICSYPPPVKSQPLPLPSATSRRSPPL